MTGPGTYEAAVIGGSSGGFEALVELLEQLGSAFRLPLLVVLHRGPSPHHRLAWLLQSHCGLVVKEADEKEPVRSGTVYLAPPDYHLLVELDQALSLSVDPPVCYARPSIDVLFESAADAYGPALVGILLSGANQDGTAGLQAIHRRGGLTLVQDPATAHASLMPSSALNAGVVDHVLSPTEIGLWLAGLPTGRTEATSQKS